MRGVRESILALCLAAVYVPVEAVTLTVTTDGNVSGAVSVIGGGNGHVCNPNPGGGPGGGTCTFTYEPNTPLRLSANSPNTPGVFILSLGTGDAQFCATSTCTFTIDQDSSVTAFFDQGGGPFRSIQITLEGDGTGNVGTDNTQCQNFELGSNVCTSYYGVGSVVTLEGRSMPGNIFEQFSGGTDDAFACGTQDPPNRCVFTLNADSSVHASFSALASVAVQPGEITINVGQMPWFSAIGTFVNADTRFLFGGQGAWRTHRPMSHDVLPSGVELTERFALGVGVLGNLLYAVGGVSGYCATDDPEPCPFGPLDTVEVYDPVATGFGGIDSWEPRTPMLIPRGGHAVAAANGRLYAIGGQTSGGVAVDSVESYDPVGGAWTAEAPMSAPRAKFATAVIGGAIYAMGGVGSDDSTPLNTLEVYDSSAGIWTTLSPMPTPRAYLAAAAVNGKLYAIGGAPDLATVEEFDPADGALGTWTTKAPMPAARAAMTAGAIDGLIYVIGGQEGPEPAGTVYVYNPALDAWATLPGAMPTPRTSLAGGVLDGRLFAIGGLASIGDTSGPAVATNEAFRPPEATWWSSDTAVATISQFTGNATGLSVGTSIISARSVGIDSGGGSALLHVSAGGGGGGGSQIFLGLPNSAQTQVGNQSWGCGSFFDQHASGGAWSGTVDYGDGSGAQPLPLIVPPPASGPCVGSGGTPTGVFVFDHAYNSPGSFQVGVTVTNTVTGVLATGGFPIEVNDDGGGGDDGCFPVSTNLTAGTVPFSTVQMAIFDRSTGELLFTADVPLGLTELGEAPEGFYRAEFSVLPGYVITPAQIDFNGVCGNAVVLSAEITPVIVNPPASSISPFVAFSRDMTWLRADVTVVTGDVGANRARFDAHPEMNDGDRDDVTVRIGRNVAMLSPTSRVVGDTLWLANQSSVYSLVYNHLFRQKGAVLGTTTTPMPTPFAVLPAFPEVSPGTSAVTVARNTTLTLAPGSYGVVHVGKGGTLVLTGGLYQVRSIALDQQATVLFRGPTELRVKTDIRSKARAGLVLDPSVPGLQASQMVIYVDGRDQDSAPGEADDDGDDGGPTIVQIGSQNTVQANIYAARGTVWLKSKTEATGAFIGLHVRVGSKVRLTLDSAF